jgi:hypothetical protein
VREWHVLGGTGVHDGLLHGQLVRNALARVRCRS